VQADPGEDVVVNNFGIPFEDPCEPTDFAAVFDFPLAEQVQAEVLMAAAQPCEGEMHALVLTVAAQSWEEELPALLAMAAAPPCDEEVRALVLMAAGHHAVDARALVGAGVPGHPAADDPFRYDYTVLFLCHPSSHAYTSHNGPNAVFHPMSASFYGSRNSVYGNTRTAHSIYIPAVSR
jgi:hypothetical protein